MICDRTEYNEDTGAISKSSFFYAFTKDSIKTIIFKKCGTHKTMTIRTNAYQQYRFDLLIICTESPYEISPTAAWVPVGVKIDRPMSAFDNKLSVYTAMPQFTAEEKKLLDEIYKGGR